jgi:hypothetical protein
MNPATKVYADAYGRYQDKMVLGVEIVEGACAIQHTPPST